MWKVICATLVIFVTGVVTGGLLVIYANHVSLKGRSKLPREIVRQPGNPPNPNVTVNPREANRLPNPVNSANRPRLGINLEFLQRLDAEVHLTAGQHERIEQIINEGQQRNKETWDRVLPEIRRENAETQRRIRETLMPEQLARFEELMKQSRPPTRRTDETLPANPRPRDLRRAPTPRDAIESNQPAPAGTP